MERTRFRVIWSTVPRPGSSDLSRLRDYSAHGTRRNGIYRLSEYHGSPEYGAPGLRCAGTSVRRDFGTHWRQRLSWRLRCAGTSVHWVYGTLGSTIVLASAVRRDFGAPGLRCAGTSVHRGGKFSGEHPRAPRFPAQVGTTCGARRPGSSDRASRSCRVSRQNPPRAPSSAGPGSGGNHPCRSPAARREQLRGYQRRTSALPSRGRNTSVDGAALLGTIDTSEALRLDAFSSVRGSPGIAAARKLRRRRGARRRPASRRPGSARCTRARRGERSHSAAGRRRQRLTHPAPRSRDKLPPSRQAAGRRKATTGASRRHRDGNYRSWEHAISTPPSTS